MIATAIVIAALLIIALLRFGVNVEYSSDGVLVKLLAGPLSFKVYPAKKDEEKDERTKKKAQKKAKREAKKKEKPPKDKLGLGIRDFMDMIPHALNMLKRVKRRLLIKNLTLRFTVGGEDAAKTAMTYGVANAAAGELMPLLHNTFRIKRYKIKFNTDFVNKEQTIYANAAFSLAVWESFYIVFALFPILKIVFRRRPAKKDGKDDTDNGKETNN